VASEAGQAVSALRQRIERINADRKNHGFGFLAARGLIKAKAHASSWLPGARGPTPGARSLRDKALPKNA
jgi:hypothetical protein